MSKIKNPVELFEMERHQGWSKLVKPVLEAAKQLDVEVLQVKEKFGGLRIYLGQAPSWLHDMCELMELLSYHVCEYCGKKGKLRNESRGWIKTLCDECDKND